MSLQRVHPRRARISVAEQDQPRLDAGDRRGVLDPKVVDVVHPRLQSIRSATAMVIGSNSRCRAACVGLSRSSSLVPEARHLEDRGVPGPVRVDVVGGQDSPTRKTRS